MGESTRISGPLAGLTAWYGMHRPRIPGNIRIAHGPLVSVAYGKVQESQESNGKKIKVSAAVIPIVLGYRFGIDLPKSVRLAVNAGFMPLSVTDYKLELPKYSKTVKPSWLPGVAIGATAFYDFSSDFSAGIGLDYLMPADFLSKEGSPSIFVISGRFSYAAF